MRALVAAAAALLIHGVATFAATCAATGAATAQTAPPTGTASGSAAAPATGVEQSAIVPYAGSAGPSAAPTMQRDCTKTPDACNAAAGAANNSSPSEPKVPN